MVLVALAALLPALEPYAGTYRLESSESDEIRLIIERTVARMNFLVRGIARSRLLKTQIAFPYITVMSSAAEFRIRHASGTDITHHDLSSPVRATAPDGTPIVVRLSAGPPLKQSYESREGQRENAYTLSGDGSKLTVDVRVTSPRLPEQIRYRLVYKRVAAADAEHPVRRGSGHD